RQVSALFMAQTVGDTGRLRLLRAARRALEGEALERCGHIEAEDAHLVERRQGFRELAGRDVDGEIRGAHAERIERGLLELGGEGVGDGMAENREESQRRLGVHPARVVVVASVAPGTCAALAMVPMRKKSTTDHAASSAPTSCDSAMPVLPMWNT